MGRAEAGILAALYAKTLAVAARFGDWITSIVDPLGEEQILRLPYPA